ncbi:hypothetical protein CHH28_01815 [Bacterioplanes sanyensis]|uniref:SPOR domain-containing protein n=1 Tax=Bacterioplanes sanyensis TaxID=1249553 RepID=A0A222FEG9_9GAMM|nr:SPOR domain-containing protein [Bacterioplanes sanyensis]ASP37485.1 hypothetical protein CHH28_01815 [Bacterioplanes sanyensis]
MRWIFFLLVLANLLLLAFFWQQQPATAAVPVTTLNVPSAEQRLQLVNEARTRLAQRQQPVAPVVSKPRLCQVAGPFMDQQRLNDARARAVAVGLQTRVKRISAPSAEPTEYWVHVPPQANRQQARKVLRELQSRRIDSYIITQGELADGVSLGLFRNQSSAENLQNQVRALGIDVRIQVVSDTQDELWLELNEADIAEDLLQRISDGMGDVRWKKLACSAG